MRQRTKQPKGNTIQPYNFKEKFYLFVTFLTMHTGGSRHVLHWLCGNASVL